MEVIKATEYARALHRTHGDRAEAEAAQKIRQCAEAGKKDEARDWKAIRRAITALRGPRQG